MSFTSGTLGIVAGLALWAAPAEAATVSAPAWRAGTGGYAVLVVAAPGEQNRISVTPAGDHLVIRDTAGLRSEPACLPVDPQTVHCPLAEGLQMQVDLGDGDDTFDMPRTAAKVTVSGGEGDDVITVEGNIFSTGELARLYGGPGDDRLYGERVEGGPGDDVLSGIFLDFTDETSGVTVDLEARRATSGAGVDQLVLSPYEDNYVWVRGGPGPDVIRAAPRRRLVAEAGAGDDVVEGGSADDNLNGGDGNDVLRAGRGFNNLSGDAGDDRLEGGPGRDGLSGGAGDDVLIGGRGRDTFSGGGGADRIEARDGIAEVVSCAGDGLVAGDRATVDAGDEVRGCRTVGRAGRQRLEVQGVVRSTRTRQVVQVWCPRGARAEACSGRLTLSRYRDETATRTVRVKPGATRRLQFTLDRDGGYGYRLRLRTGQIVRGTVDRVL